MDALRPCCDCRTRLAVPNGRRCWSCYQARWRKVAKETEQELEAAYGSLQGQWRCCYCGVTEERFLPVVTVPAGGGDKPMWSCADLTACSDRMEARGEDLGRRDFTAAQREKIAADLETIFAGAG